MPATHFGLMRHGARTHAPMSPLASPLLQPAHLSKDELKAKEQEFNAKYGNKGNERVPLPQGNPTWTLDDILTAPVTALIKANGKLSFHAVGDTGFDSFPFSKSTGLTTFGKANKQFEEAERIVAEAMAGDLDGANVHRGPAFLLHLGDVIYFDNTRSGYGEQFYDPFSSYTRKIIAIPGNHDIEVRLSRQNSPLEAFLENFCHGTPWVPPAARNFHPPREMAAQPGAFWRLDAPFVQIIGLCSNVGEEGGTLEDPNTGPEQYAWFQQTLKEVAASQKAEGENRRALLIALHHPPFTHGNHLPSDDLGNQLDRAFEGAGVWPDVVLAAHDHNYQRFTRIKKIDGKRVEIPYLVAGGGGRFSTQFTKAPTTSSSIDPGVELITFNKGNGYLIVTASPGRVTLEYRAVDHHDQNVPETIVVDLHERRIRHA